MLAIKDRVGEMEKYEEDRKKNTLWDSPTNEDSVAPIIDERTSVAPFIVEKRKKQNQA